MLERCFVIPPLSCPQDPEACLQLHCHRIDDVTVIESLQRGSGQLETPLKVTGLVQQPRTHQAKSIMLIGVEVVYRNRIG
jgi:hypothetical protein